MRGISLLLFQFQAGQLSNSEYEELDELHYEVENELLSLIKSLQREQKSAEWDDDLHSK
jgi:hypothetical protein